MSRAKWNGKYIDHKADSWEDALEKAIFYNQKFQSKIFRVVRIMEDPNEYMGTGYA